MKRIRNLLRRRPPPAPHYRFYDSFANGTGQWEYETGTGFVGDQDYAIDRFDPLTNGYGGGIHLVATPDRRSVRMLSKEAPFVQGTRLTYTAELDPAQDAVWPALWSIGRSVDWPRCGEVDAMECGLGGRWEIKQTVHTADTYASRGDYGLGSDAMAVPEGLAQYSAEWRGEAIRFSVNGVHTATVAYTATEPLRLVMNVALRSGVALAAPWCMWVREVSVDPLV